MDIKELIDLFNVKSLEMKTAQEKADKEVKEAGEIATETKTLLSKTQSELEEVKSQFGKMDDALKELQLKAHKYDQQKTEVKTMGSIITESQQFKTALDTNATSMQAVKFSKKDITGVAASAGSLVRPDRDPTVYQNPTRPTRIRDLIPTVPTSSSSVEYMRELVFTNNAGPQGDTIGKGVGELESKNKSNITYELVTKNVPTIAHYIIASRQVLSDAPMLQGLINTRLAYGLDLESDDQLLLGDGTGQNLDGIMVDSAINDVGEIANGTTDAQLPGAMIDHIRSAITKCQLMEYYNINGLVLNPQDWETLETAKATDGHYLMVAMPTQTAEMTVWRIPVVITNAMSQGSFLLGDWSMGAVIYDREDISIRVSDSHASLFVQNGVAVLAEERYTLGIPLPKAFCKGSFAVAEA